MTFYDFTLQDIASKNFNLSELKGKTVLIVNTASKCGYTPQYKGLEALYQKYKAKGLMVLGFPSNDFGKQEPGTNAEIADFCDISFKTTFKIFSKGEVKGSAAQPLFKYLTQEANPSLKGEIKWNFEKFLIDKDGKLIQRFDSKAEPIGADIEKSIEAVL